MEGKNKMMKNKMIQKREKRKRHEHTCPLAFMDSVLISISIDVKHRTLSEK